MHINSNYHLSKSKVVAFENTIKGPKADRLRAENFYDCIRPVYILSRIFGLLPFSINYDTNGHAESVCVRMFDAIWFAGAMAINLIFIYFMIDFIKGSSPTRSAFSEFGGRLILIFSLVNSSLSIILDLFNQSRLLKISKDFFAFDAEVVRS